MGRNDLGILAVFLAVAEERSFTRRQTARCVSLPVEPCDPGTGRGHRGSSTVPDDPESRADPVEAHQREPVVDGERAEESDVHHLKERQN
jgi:hypothetical protein